MNQRLSDWASIAEIVSGIAVAVTLVILILGVRDNTQVIRAGMYTDHIEALNEQGRYILSDQNLLPLWLAFIDRDKVALESLEELDRLRLTEIVHSVFRNYEKAWVAREAGVFGENEWDRFSRQICINFRRVQTAGMVDDMTVILTDDFKSFILETCAGRAE